MPHVVRNILAIIAGVVLGSIVNMGIILMSSSVIAPPAGADVTTAEGLKASMHLFQPKHFIFPFVAHALGTFVGAYITLIDLTVAYLPMAYLAGKLVSNYHHPAS